MPFIAPLSGNEQPGCRKGHRASASRGWREEILSFATLAYAKKLREGGLTEEQAEAHTQAQKQVLTEILDATLATKMDKCQSICLKTSM